MMKNKRCRPYRANYRIQGDSYGNSTIVKLRYPDKTIWQSIKDFIENIEIDETFTRKELLKFVYKTQMAHLETTIDGYRNLLTHAGVLERIGIGKYTKRKNIPKTLSTKQLRDLTNKRNWKSWFTPLEAIDQLSE